MALASPFDQGDFPITCDQRRKQRVRQTVGPGTIVFIPRNVVHRFKNVGNTTGCMLDWTLPGGQDHYFKAISDLAAAGGLTGEKVTEINEKFDTKFLAAH
jgi:hypothetical protein